MIKDLQLNNSTIGFFGVKEILEKDKKGSSEKYLDLTLIDSSGEINAKIWEIDNNVIIDRPINGSIVKVSALVHDYKGKLQLKINKIRLATEADNYDIRTIAPSAPLSANDMWNTLNRFINAIKDQGLKRGVSHIIEQHKEKILYYPAAKSLHHSHKKGYLQHFKTILQAAEKLAPIYMCDTDLLYSGAILHDIGKLYELEPDELCISTINTLEGELLGHITIGINLIDQMAGIDKETKLLLKHMILSHHQNPEWGSPKRPMFKEAEMLHQLDVLDSRMFDFDKASAQTEEGHLSSKVYSLDRKVYRRNKSK